MVVNISGGGGEGGRSRTRSSSHYIQDQHYNPNRRNGMFHKRSDPLSYLYWNQDQGLLPNMECLDRLVKVHKPAVLVLGNTGLDSSHDGAERELSGYNGFHVDANDDAANGGLSVYIKHGLEAARLRELEINENLERCPMIVLKIIEKEYIRGEDGISLKDKVTICICVVGEDDDDADLDRLLDGLQTLLSNIRNLYTGAPVLIIGTLEMYNQDWVSCITDTSPLGERLRATVTQFGLVPKNREATWFSDGSEDIQGDCVDHVIGSEDIRCKVTLLPIEGYSEHKPIVLVQDKTYCSPCKVGFNFPKEFLLHVETSKHRTNLILSTYQKHGERFRNNQNNLGLELTLKESSAGIHKATDKPGIIVISADENQTRQLKICLRNVGAPAAKGDTGIIIDSIGLLRPDDCFTLTDENNLTQGVNKKLRILPLRSYKVGVSCVGRQVGHHKVVFMVAFYHEELSNKVQDVGRYELSHMALELHLHVINPELQNIKCGVPYEKPKPFSVWNVTETVPGVPVNFGTEDKLNRVVDLEHYKIPAIRKKVIERSFEGSSAAERREAAVYCTLLRDGLSSSNYKEWMHLLLHAEELQMEFDIRHYDMKDVPVTFQRGLLKLRVPGLEENRPSVLKGDRLYLKLAGSTREYEGYVHETGESCVLLGVDGSLSRAFIQGMKVDVRFTINRFPLRNMHRAVDLASQSLLGSLFPVKSGSSGHEDNAPPKLNLYNRLIGSNPAQLQAVENIVARTSGHFPYIVFGPPGTGKTITAVESIKQLLTVGRGYKVLAAAPSNAAADILAERLVENIQRNRILRFIAPSRTLKGISQKVLDVSNVKKGGEIFIPTLEELSKYDVIIVTLCSAGRLVSANFKADHFSHVLIDECGHAMEPESCIALTILSERTLKSKGQVVLVGDPKQLGPILRSAHTKENRLEVSLLERLMNSDLYKEHPETGFNKAYITKLVNNFRSHPAILALPSRLYYNNELVAAGNPVLINSMLGFPGLPDRARGKFPVIFHGVVGQDQREERSPSFFNPEEIVLVVKYVKQILDLKTNKIKGKEIGIISPYRRQVQKIREQLYSKGGEYKDITVGSTEEFQGQERRVIIISSVRSEPQYVNTDRQYKLGFLRNNKRFNVAITRAKALMIVVGNPHILGQDPAWAALLEYTQSNGGYTGCTYTPETDGDLDRLEQSLTRLVLQDNAELSPVTLYEEPAWRADH